MQSNVNQAKKSIEESREKIFDTQTKIGELNETNDKLTNELLETQSKKRTNNANIDSLKEQQKSVEPQSDLVDLDITQKDATIKERKAKVDKFSKEINELNNAKADIDVIIKENTRNIVKIDKEYKLKKDKLESAQIELTGVAHQFKLVSRDTNLLNFVVLSDAKITKNIRCLTMKKYFYKFYN